MALYSPFSKEELTPQPEKILIKKRKGNLYIGIPKETHFQEKRICISPDSVQTLVAQGHRILIEKGAGEGAHFSDQDYAESGAEISNDTKKVFACPIVLKVEPPSAEEIELMSPSSTLISALQLKTKHTTYFELLAKKKITAIAFDFMRDEHGSYPVVKSLSEIAGNASILIASELLSNVNQGNGLLFGNIAGVPPTDIVILGAGTVGLHAAKAALGLGARVKVYDNSITKLRELQDKLGQNIYTSTVQPKYLQKALMRCDVAIGAVRGKSRAPILVTEAMVENMKDGAVIVDVSIDMGGCFETSEVTTHDHPTYNHKGIIHYCVPNIPSRYSRTASLSLSNIFTPYLTEIAEAGGLENALRYNLVLRSGIYLYRGILTSKSISDWFDIPSQDINLLIL